MTTCYLFIRSLPNHIYTFHSQCQQKMKRKRFISQFLVRRVFADQLGIILQSPIPAAGDGAECTTRNRMPAINESFRPEEAWHKSWLASLARFSIGRPSASTAAGSVNYSKRCLRPAKRFFPRFPMFDISAVGMRWSNGGWTC